MKWMAEEAGASGKLSGSQVAVHRVARGKDRHGFGNGRDLRSAFEKAAKRAQARDDFDPKAPCVKMVDVIGPDPSPENHVELRLALAKLNEMQSSMVQEPFVAEQDRARPPWPPHHWLKGPLEPPPGPVAMHVSPGTALRRSRGRSRRSLSSAARQKW